MQIETLLANGGFVRRLARSLLTDEQHAEDVAQETLVTFLEGGFSGRGSIHSWLSSVVRNLAAKVVRGEGRRTQRERHAAKPEELPSVSELFERESARRTVVDAVFALEEPYRSTLLMRYFEELPPREVARRLALPIETVRTRTKRALDQLRARLEDAHGGGRSSWSAGLVALAAHPISASAVATPAAAALHGAFIQGVLLMSTKLKFALAGVLLVASSLAVWNLVDRGLAEPATRPAEAIALAPAPVESRAAGDRRAVPAPREIAGARVFGRVRDEGGTLVPPVTVSLRGPARKDFHRCSSTDDETFEFENRIPAGTWTLRVDGERKLLTPKELIVDATQDELRIDVVLEKLDASAVISGVVVDETGERAAGVSVAAKPITAEQSHAFALSKKDGTFEIVRKGDAKGPVRLGATSPPRFEALYDAGGPFEWGTAGLKLELRRASGVDVLVVDALTRAPVERFAVRCFQNEVVADGREAALREPGKHAGGRLLVTGVVRGKNLLTVYPEDESLMPSEPIPFVRTEAGTPPIRVELQRALSLPLQVTRRDGSPVKGSKLELVRLIGAGPLKLDTPSRDSAAGDIWGAFALRWSSAQTDEEGRATLRGPSSRGELAVKVLGPGHTAVLREHVVLTPDCPVLPIVIDGGATLVGKIQPLVALAKLRSAAPGQELGLKLRSGERDLLPLNPHASFLFDAKGTFRIEGIPPGTWDILFRDFETRGRVSSERKTLLKAGVELAEGEVREIELDVSGLLPARLRGQVLIDGKPFANGTLSMIRALPDAHGELKVEGSTESLSTDEHGSFDAKLFPSHYLLVASVPAAGGKPAPLYAKDWVQVPGDGDLEHQFHLSHLRARVRILDSDGKIPVRGRKLTVRWDGFLQEHWLETDADGLLILDPAPPGPFRLGLYPEHLDWKALWEMRMKDRETFAKLEITLLGPVEIPPGERETACELRLPAHKD